jgi:ATP-dependent protease ClpP protease subunit
MKHEIKIYGDIVPFKWLNDGSEYDLKDLSDSLDALDIKEGEELKVRIHTFGGDTTTAFGMYNLLKRFKNENNISIRTIVDGYCASSGVILLLAGDKDKRTGSKYLKPFVHNAWLWQKTDQHEAKKVYEELVTVDNEIAELYSEETTITKDIALQFMKESRDLKVDECIKYGFYTELENVHVVENSMIFNSIISRNQENRKLIKNNMSDKNKEAERKNLWNQIENFFKGAGPKNKIVFTAENSELDFYELGENDTPKVGDKAQFDGKPAGESNNGEYVMQSGETYKFTGEELTEIVPKAVEDSELQAENEALTVEVQNLKKQLKEKDTEISNLKSRNSEAIKIIENFKKLESGVGSGEESPRNPKPENPKPENRDLFKNLKL